MTREYSRLPQLDRLFLTDAGLESDMIYNRGFDLPHFSSIVLLADDRGRGALATYYREFIDLACKAGTGFLLESATWRSSPDWAGPLGLSQAEMDELNRRAIALLVALRDQLESNDLPIVVSGCIGPRGDGYDPGRIMTAEEAAGYHTHQAKVLASAGADMLAGITMTSVNEGVGVSRAAERAGLPVAISFTVETDGTLPTGDQLGDAIAQTDALTGGYPAYYMVNCAHPTHFAGRLLAGGSWTSRIRGIRANASRCSHAELDVMTELDPGDPIEFGVEYRELLESLPHLTVLGGCCGTDIRHITEIAKTCAPRRAVAA